MLDPVMPCPMHGSKSFTPSSKILVLNLLAGCQGKMAARMCTAASEFYGLIVIVIPSLYLDTSDHSVIKMTSDVANYKIRPTVQERYGFHAVAGVRQRGGITRGGGTEIDYVGREWEGWVYDATIIGDNILQFSPRFKNNYLVESGHQKVHNTAFLDLDFVREYRLVHNISWPSGI